MYRMHRVFCATAWELEDERTAFYDVIGRFNETEAMGRGILYVPVSLPTVADKRPLQSAVNENIRACRYYILATADDWGPRERNFEPDYHLALACRVDKSLPMRETAILLKDRPDCTPSPFGPALDAAGFPSIAFRNTAAFSEAVGGLLAQWLVRDAAETPAAGTGA
jgi:hypothetical protein